MGKLKFEKEGKMRISILIFIYTSHFAYLRVYTHFHNPKSSSCWENFGEKCPYQVTAQSNENCRSYQETNRGPKITMPP